MKDVFSGKDDCYAGMKNLREGKTSTEVQETR